MSKRNPSRRASWFLSYYIRHISRTSFFGKSDKSTTTRTIRVDRSIDDDIVIGSCAIVMHRGLKTIRAILPPNIRRIFSRYFNMHNDVT
jgi:hypothetical protein